MVQDFECSNEFKLFLDGKEISEDYLHGRLLNPNNDLVMEIYFTKEEIPQDFQIHISYRVYILKKLEKNNKKSKIFL